jgi:hypothetical protein
MIFGSMLIREGFRVQNMLINYSFCISNIVSILYAFCLLFGLLKDWVSSTGIKYLVILVVVKFQGTHTST